MTTGYAEVAEWLSTLITERGALVQTDVLAAIERLHGSQFVYTNQNGNSAIDRRVLHEFRRLTSGRVVWDRSLRGWRLRKPTDPPGRRAN
jgi:hypothetical protein